MSPTVPLDRPTDTAPRSAAFRALNTWCVTNPPDPGLNYAPAVTAQFDRLKKLAGDHDLPAAVIGTHTSKSCTLPVAFFRLAPEAWLAVRDNFHDTNVIVRLPHDCDLTAEELFGEGKDWDWYRAKMARCEGYTWRGWSQEELEDERITRVKAPTSDGKGTFWNNTTPEKKARWLARMTDPSWMTHDWSEGDLFVVGDMGPSAIFYEQPTCFAEGMHEALEAALPPQENIRAYFKPWRPGATRFILRRPHLDAVDTLIKLLDSRLKSKRA